MLVIVEARSVEGRVTHMMSGEHVPAYFLVSTYFLAGQVYNERRL